MPKAMFLKKAKLKPCTLLFIGVVVLVFLAMLVMSYMTPLTNDDYFLARSQTWADALRREYTNYLTRTGRSISQFSARVFLMLPRAVFFTVNAAVYTGLTLLIYKMAAARKQANLVVYLFIIACLWLFSMNFGQTTLWLIGSLTYLWGTFYILCFLLPYHMYVHRGNSFSAAWPTGGRWVFAVLMLLAGAVAGWCNENTSAVAIFLALAAIIYCIKSGKKPETWMLGGLLGAISTYVIMIRAPGNFARAGGELITGSWPALLALRISHVTGRVQENLSYLAIIFIILFALQLVLCHDKKRAFVALSYAIAAVLSTYAMIVSPLIPARAFFGATVFLIIACVYLLAGFSLEHKAIKFTTITLLSVLLLRFTTTFIIGFYDIAKTYEDYSKMFAYIQAEVDKGIRDVEVPEAIIEFPVYENPWNPLYDVGWQLHSDREYYVNRYIADIFGIDSVRRRYAVEDLRLLEEAAQEVE